MISLICKYVIEQELGHTIIVILVTRQLTVPVTLSIICADHNIVTVPFIPMRVMMRRLK